LVRWYTILKYAKWVFLLELQEKDAKPRRSNLRISLAVLLLVTAGLTLPLSSLGVASVSASSVTGAASGVRVVVVQQADLFHGKVVLDGVASVVVVAPPSAEGSHQVDEFDVLKSQPSTGGSSAGTIVNGSLDGVAHGYFHAQKLGFALGPSTEQGQGYGLSAQWLSNGAMPRAWSIGEMALVPVPTSATSSVTAAVPKVWWDFFQRRSKFEIYVEILELMKRGPMTPFEVAFYARLNHKRTKEYAEFLAEAGYLHPVTEEGRALYALTKDGIGFLDGLQSLLARPGIIQVASPGYQRDF